MAVKTHEGMLRYRLKLLSEQPRFYVHRDGYNRALERRALIVRTGRLDEHGRIEWAVTDAGRERLRQEMAVSPDPRCRGM